MRKELAKINGKRYEFIGTFKRFGKKRGYKVDWLPTVLLVNVNDAEGNLMTDHLWFNLTKGFQKLNLQAGDVVQFDARVEPYQKGYSEDDEENPFRIDYKLSRPTKLKKIGRDPRCNIKFIQTLISMWC